MLCSISFTCLNWYNLIINRFFSNIISVICSSMCVLFSFQLPRRSSSTPVCRSTACQHDGASHLDLSRNQRRTRSAPSSLSARVSKHVRACHVHRQRVWFARETLPIALLGRVRHQRSSVRSRTLSVSPLHLPGYLAQRRNPVRDDTGCNVEKDLLLYNTQQYPLLGLWQI